jgi:hypothetical protein
LMKPGWGLHADPPEKGIKSSKAGKRVKCRQWF